MRKLSILLVSSLFSSHAAADEPPARVPRSAAEHLFLADSYDRQAEEYEAAAQKTRSELKRFLREESVFPNKTGRELPRVLKRRHADETSIREAEERAALAVRSAEYHRMRAIELEGHELDEAERVLGRPAPPPTRR